MPYQYRKVDTYPNSNSITHMKHAYLYALKLAPVFKPTLDARSVCTIGC